MTRYATAAAAERARIQARDAKRRRRGTCKECGAETRYNGVSVNGPSEYCVSCANHRSHAQFKGRGPIQLAVLGLLAHGEARYSYIRNTLGLSSEHAAITLNRLVSYGLVERVRRGVYRLPS
jgi:putative AbiEi antitoxin of type IV toxin-antitoxin system